jgi:hypothetical protein
MRLYNTFESDVGYRLGIHENLIYKNEKVVNIRASLE